MTAARLSVFLPLLLCALCAAFDASAQETPPATTAPAATPPATPVVDNFETVAACQSLAAALKEVEAQSALLDSVLTTPAEDSDTFLKGIFVGTQTMMNYGDALFKATAEHEDACKEKLRAANNHADIIQIYRLLLTPTLRGYDFLIRVRTSADKLADADTARDMTEALDGYSTSMNKLVEFCRQDLQEDALPPDAPKPCEAFRAEIEQRTKPK
jgi:hypothetical protein